MIATTPRSRVSQPSAAAEALLRPGKNCWRVERANRFYCVQDAADYFRHVRDALLRAERTVFILGWDILAAVDLLPGAIAPDAPTRLDQLLAFVARRRPQLRCYILIWDYAALYTLERDPLSRWKLGWKTPRRVRFGFDDRHPVGGSHHQKIVVVDDRLAFCGGIDLTGHRWDTSAHRVDEPARTNAMGEPYEPYHEIQAMVDGPVAASLGALARDRWRTLGEERMPPLGEPGGDLWPPDVTPDVTDVDVAIARTVPGSATQPAIRECEALFFDSIAIAKRTIYIESQYFTNNALCDALAARLKEPDGPEIVVVVPRECHGWLERNTMGAFRDAVFRQLMAADTHKRLRLVYPLASRAQNVPIFIHSKVMIVDDTFVRIGSANFSRRSMGVDTECDLAAAAGGDPGARSGIGRIRDRLLAEHLDLPVDAVAVAVARDGSLLSVIDSREGADHTLLRIDAATVSDEVAPATLQAAADPEEPIAFGSTLTQLVPPVEATHQRSHLREWILPVIVLLAAVASVSSMVISRSELQSVRDGLETIPRMPSTVWIGVGLFLLTGLVMVPVELMAIAAGLLFGAFLGTLIALLGSFTAAAIGYGAGRVIGSAGVSRWMSRRSYRSARQLGAHGILGVLILRLSSVASAESIHLLCGAGRVPFATFMAGTVIGLAPAMVILSCLGGLLRQTLLDPSLRNGLITIGAAVLLLAVAAGLRAFLLIRQFAPSASRQRERAEFG